MTDFITTADGTNVAYSDTGTGLPLLCLAGLTRTMADFDYLRPHLPPLRLICMDYRGRGASGWTNAADYTVMQEAQDVLALLNQIGVAQVAILGTSRGGIIGLLLAAIAKDRLRGLCLNDVGPVIERHGLERIAAYVGRNPPVDSHVEMALRMPQAMQGFANVPPGRWLAEAQKHYRETESGLQITYDPVLRDAFVAGLDAAQPDAWPLFDACVDMPVALIRGGNSDLLSMNTVHEMQRRRPDLIFANVPDRAHVPFLDEPKSLQVIRTFLKAVA